MMKPLRPLLSLLLSLGAVACPRDVVGEGEGEEGEGEGGEGEGEGEAGEGEGEDFVARFVAVGYGGRRLTSFDGRAWENDVEDAADGGDDDNLLRGVCAGQIDGRTVILAVGGSRVGRVLRSDDGGASWTSHVDEDGWIGACAHHDGVFVFVGSARSARSTDGGRTLVDRATHFLADRGNWEMRDVEFIDGEFVAVGDTGVSTSADGVVWTEPAGPSDLSRVQGGAGVAVAVGANKRAVSADHVVWDEVSDGANDLVFGDGRFLLVGEGFRLTSPDGTTFSLAAQPALGRVTFGVVAGTPTWLGANFRDVRRLSENGEDWQDVADDGGNAIEDLLFVE